MSALTSTRPLRQVDTVKEMLANQQAAEQLRAVAASHLNPEKMMRTLAMAISKTPLLGQCTPMSLLGALMTSSSLGLEVNTVMGHAYLLPFRNNKAKTVEAQLVVGYRGYLFLAANAGVAVHADIHYSDDPVWVWKKGASPDLLHESGACSGDMLHAYAVGIGQNGFKTWVVWPEAKLVAHRDRYSKGYAADVKQGKTAASPNVNIWIADPALARTKTMVRQIQKALPMAREMAYASALDGARADYVTFAMDPSSGLPQPAGTDEALEYDADDGTIIESEASPAGDTATPGPDGKAALAAAKEKAAAAAATAKAPEKSAPAPAETKAAEPLPEPAWLSGFYNELSQWPRDEAALDELKSIYAAQFATVKGTPLYSEIHLEIRRHAAGSDGAADGDDHGAEG